MKKKTSKSKKSTRLTAAELASLDALITLAQQKGRKLTDRLDHTEEQAEAQAELHEAMWEARHGGFEFGQRDREILRKIRSLASELEVAPTLKQLVELRGAALREQARG